MGKTWADELVSLVDVDDVLGVCGVDEDSDHGRVVSVHSVHKRRVASQVFHVRVASS